MPPSSRRRRRRTGLGLVLLALVGLVVGAVALTGLVLAQFRDRPTPPPSPRCLATTGDHTTLITADQAWWTSIIVGTSVKRKLPPRAASIAMATVYQETDIRNLDHGDRDSVGLFQQRPSQGWGTVKQIMDPYYSTGKFYDTLVKVKNWQGRDITEVAQAVQRSGFPEAYRDHETDGRTLASTFAGWTPGGLSCLYPAGPGDAKGLNAFLVKTLGVKAGSVTESVITFRAGSDEQAWAIAHLAIATGSRYGATEVVTGGKRWQHRADVVADWTTSDVATPSRQVVVTVA